VAWARLPLVPGEVMTVSDTNSSNDTQADRIEKAVNQVQSEPSALNDALSLLQSYNTKLASAGQRDELLTALVDQYTRLSRATVIFEQFTGNSGSRSETQGRIAEEILRILQEDIIRTVVREDLPGRPLIIRLAPNLFRVIFNVPMRIPPELKFTGLPEGVIPEVTDKSEISFTVRFFPPSVPVDRFGFSADARL
jgi:hypothetical protein